MSLCKFSEPDKACAGYPDFDVFATDTVGGSGAGWFDVEKPVDDELTARQITVVTLFKVSMLAQ